jgi:hypothetical protein
MGNQAAGPQIDLITRKERFSNSPTQQGNNLKTLHHKSQNIPKEKKVTKGHSESTRVDVE